MMTSAELYAACRSQDLSIQEDAYNRLWDYLYQVALKIVYDQPNAPDLAQDCAQEGLVRIHNLINECHTPTAFLGWSRTIVGHIAIDILRKRGRLMPLEEDDGEETGRQWPGGGPSLEEEVVAEMMMDQILDLLNKAPISQRSRLTITSRFVDDLPDESLAESVSQLEGKEVLPSHLQVTRSKNLKKLQKWPLLRQSLKPEL
jgi:RNA polymerase sigma factor (sigma-70 family)